MPMKYIKNWRGTRYPAQRFPRNRSGVEIKILKKIFRLNSRTFCDLRLTFETAQQWPKGRAALWKNWTDSSKIWESGQLFSIDFGEIRVFKMLPGFSDI